MKVINNALTRTVCSSGICTGCKACLNVCSKGAITVRDNLDSFEPVIDISKCVDCGLCTKVCPGIARRKLRDPIYSRQGWAPDSIRKTSSSGGAASELIRSFIANGGYVASCMFRDGEFKFVVTGDPSEAKLFAGSKYVKSDPKLIYNEVREILNKGSKVLFIGLPCQVAAVLNVCENIVNTDKLYTADLICHGTPSVKLLEMYLADNNIELDKAKDVSFREGNNFGLIVDGNRLMPGNILDHYTYAFLKSIDYFECCYDCKYAVIRRVSDITLGDAWGQMSDTDPNGVSLILCQTEKGRELVENAGLELFDVDLEKAVPANPQLNHPSEKPDKRDLFFKIVKNGKSFSTAMKKMFPMFCVKNSVKLFVNKRRIR